MTRLIFNQVKLNVWIYILLLCAGIVFNVFLLGKVDHQPLKVAGLIAYTLVFCGPLLLIFQLNRGIARPLLSLPVSRSAAGLALWFTSVVVPTVLLCLMVGASFLISWFHDGLDALAPGPLVLFLASAFAYYGSVHCVLTWMPSQGSSAKYGTVIGTLIGGAFGLLIGGGVFILNFLSRAETFDLRDYLILAVGIGLTIIGMTRSETMLMIRSSSFPVGGGGDSHAPETKVTASETKGIPFLFHYAFTQSTKFAVLFFAAFFVMNLILMRHLPWTPEHLSSIARNMWPAMIFGIFPSLHWLSQLRFFRTLPMTSTRLSALVSSLFLIPAVLLTLILLGLTWYPVGSVPKDWLQWAMFMPGVVLVFVGAIINAGTMKMIPVAVALSFPAGFLVVNSNFSLNPAAALGIAILLLLIGYSLFYIALIRSNRTYRTGLVLKFEKAGAGL
jgi:hypothetical protein